MSSTELLLIARRMLRRNWEVFLLVVIGCLLLWSLQLIVDASIKHSQYPLIQHSMEVLDLFRRKVLPILQPISFLAGTCYLLLPLSVQWRRAIVDTFALWYILRIAHLFILINLLIFLSTSDHVLLIAQLLLFLPCTLLMWGWIYWRMDVRSCINTGKPMFAFDLADGMSPTVYDYFLVSFTSLISHTLSGFSGKTRTARTLIFIHGVMMWDVMGLMLSRAIALISS